MRNIYFANGLFNEADRDFNAKVVAAIREKFKDEVNVYLPQENEAINDKSNFANSVMIAAEDNHKLDSADVLIAVLDGEIIDPGVACEIGYASASGIRIIGLTTDSRKYYEGENRLKKESVIDTLENQYHYKNLYVIGNVRLGGEIVTSIDELLNEL